MKISPQAIWRRMFGWKLIPLAFFALAASQAQAETAAWSDNFDTNAASRWTTSTGWAIGSPTTGSGTHSGADCASTGLYGNAPANAEFRFACTNYNGSNTIAIPAASQFPRLRFWQWFDFVNSAGWVEIRPAGSTNWQAITTSTNIGIGSAYNASGGWSRSSIDLRAYAGTNVQIAFHFLAGGTGYGNDLGWSVDDVALITNPPVFNNPEGFESGLGDWSVSGGSWGVGRPTSGPSQAHSGTNCVGTILSGNYNPNADSRLISPPFLVPTNTRSVLRFSQWYQFYNALGYVEISTNGSSWQVLSTNISIGSAGISSGGWTNTSIDLSAYAGQGVVVAFHFQSGGTGYGNAAGWYIDDVAVAASPILIIPTNVIPVYATTTLTVNLQALIAPGGPVTFALLAGSPTNAVLNPSTGVFAWTPTTAQIGTNTVTISVTDTNDLSTTNSFYVQVLPPISLTVPANQIIYAGQTFSATITATNTSTNATFSYGLAAAPANVQLDTTNGALVWTPTSAQAGTNIIAVLATQTSNTNPPVPSVTNSFSVQVNLPPAPQLKVNSSVTATNGFQFSFTNYNGISWQINVSTDLFNWTPLTNATVSNNVLNISDPAATNYSRRFYRAVLP